MAFNTFWDETKILLLWCFFAEVYFYLFIYFFTKVFFFFYSFEVVKHVYDKIVDMKGKMTWVFHFLSFFQFPVNGWEKIREAWVENSVCADSLWVPDSFFSSFEHCARAQHARPNPQVFSTKRSDKLMGQCSFLPKCCFH